MDPKEHARVVTELARREGFHRVGFTQVGELAGFRRYEEWIAKGYAGEMHYLVEQAPQRRSPALVFPRATTAIVVALSYGPRAGTLISPETLVRPLGKIARYAQGGDYHLVVKDKLRAIGKALPDALGHPVDWVACVDTQAVLERELAQASGLGFLAKNTMLIAPGLGSYFVLGVLLVDFECAAQVVEEPRCGACRACLDACPTGAFVDAHTLDARRCISYLTIEYPGVIPRELRDKMGAHIFGCDVCQEVCPFNQSRELPPPAPELAPRLSHDAQDLLRLLSLGAAQFRKWNRRAALRRVHRAQLRRNVAVALGNVGTADAIEPLAVALSDDRPLVRQHVAWALGELGVRLSDPRPLAYLRARQPAEPDPEVLEEIGFSINRLAG